MARFKITQIVGAAKNPVRATYDLGQGKSIAVSILDYALEFVGLDCNSFGVDDFSKEREPYLQWSANKEEYIPDTLLREAVLYSVYYLLLQYNIGGSIGLSNIGYELINYLGGTVVIEDDYSVSIKDQYGDKIPYENSVFFLPKNSSYLHAGAFR